MSETAGIYVRQSEDEKEGIDRALERCRNLAKARGWTLAGEYKDNYVSASKARGAETDWSRLLAAVRSGAVTVVVGVDVDRLVRSVQDLGVLIDLGVKVLTVDGEIDLTTADGEFRATMLAGIARFEVRRKAERQIRANSHRVLSLGLPVPGKRRYGFEAGNVVERPEEADVVRGLYSAVLDGASIFGLAQSLGRPPVRVREILTNPAYAGWIPYQGERYEAAEGVARVVDRSTWEAVQSILAAPERKTSHSNQIAYLASGLARCGVCDARMVKQGPGYLCKGNLSHPYIKREILDEVLMGEAWTYLMGTLAEPEPEALREVVAELAALKRKRAATQDMATWEGADVAAARREVGALGRQIEAAELRLSGLRASTVAGAAVDRIRASIVRLADDPSFEADEELAAEWERTWKDLPLSDQREVLSNLDIRVHKGRGPERVIVTAR